MLNLKIILFSAKLLIEQFKEKANILHLQMETKMVENKERIKQLTDKLR